MAILGANAQGRDRGLDRHREDTRVPLVGRVRTNPEANLAGMVDCHGSDFRADRRDHFGGRRDRAVEERSGDSIRTGSRERDARQIDRTMRPPGRGCEQDVSDRDANNQLSVQRRQKGNAGLQQGGARKERLGVFGHEG